jgi:peptidoglycan/xylan/chitin deacetylase (PgdA/CDA1 family)
MPGKRSRVLALTLAPAITACAILGPSSARAAACGADKLGTSRVLAVDPIKLPRVGTLQYGATLPLEDHEVVLTFDDGPLSPYTQRVLDTLAAECVKATFFVVGSMADAYPQLVRRAYDEGHTIGTHTQTHPLRLLRVDAMERQIDDGIASVGRALGQNRELAPFFRFPGLLRSAAVEDYLASKRIMVWSTDVLADDWKRITPDDVIARALRWLALKGKGILLLHDIHKRTALALPKLLKMLKQDGYRVVQVAPAAAERDPVVAAPRSWAPDVP